MSEFMREFTKAAQEGPRLFFAPIVGAVEAVRNEMNRWRTPGEASKSGNRSANHRQDETRS